MGRYDKKKMALFSAIGVRIKNGWVFIYKTCMVCMNDLLSGDST